MIELKHILLAEQAIINQISGQLSLINVINAINVPGLPQDVNALFFVINWQRDRNEKADDIAFRMRISVEHNGTNINPSKEVAPISVEIPKNEYIVNTVGNISLKITKDGEYRIIVEKETDGKWKEVGSMSVEVIVVKKK